jgi:hypothetical protein
VDALVNQVGGLAEAAMGTTAVVAAAVGLLAATVGARRRR